MKISKFTSWFFIILIAVVATSCGSQENAVKNNGIPVWVDNPGSIYSDDEYLMAVGSGSTLNEATTDAFASLSKIFQMDVNATEELQDMWTETSRNNREVFTEGTTKLLNNIKIGTNQELMNTSILESELVSNGTYYALAGMNRAESSRIYSQEISNNVIKIDELEENAENEHDVLQKLVLLKKARLLANVNETLSKQFSIIRRGSADTELATRRLSRIEENFRTVQQSAIIKISSDNATNTIKSAVAEVLQKAGFTVAENAGSEVLEVVINFETQKADLKRDDAEFVKWELVIQVQDKQSNRSFNTFITEGRDGALSFDDALKRADFTARNKIENQFNTFLTQELLAIK